MIHQHALDYMIAMIAHPHFRLNLVKEYLNVGEREREERRAEEGGGRTRT
jgi:hypothetical protein